MSKSEISQRKQWLRQENYKVSFSKPTLTFSPNILLSPLCFATRAPISGLSCLPEPQPRPLSSCYETRSNVVKFLTSNNLDWGHIRLRKPRSVPSLLLYKSRLFEAQNSDDRRHSTGADVVRLVRSIPLSVCTLTLPILAGRERPSYAIVSL